MRHNLVWSLGVCSRIGNLISMVSICVYIKVMVWMVNVTWNYRYDFAKGTTGILDGGMVQKGKSQETLYLIMNNNLEEGLY